MLSHDSAHSDVLLCGVDLNLTWNAWGCVCVCMYAFMYVCLYMYVCVFVHVHIYICVCMCTQGIRSSLPIWMQQASHTRVDSLRSAMSQFRTLVTSTNFAGMRDAFAYYYANGGFRGLFRGAGISFLKVLSLPLLALALPRPHTIMYSPNLLPPPPLFISFLCFWKQVGPYGGVLFMAFEGCIRVCTWYNGERRHPFP